MDLEWTDPAQVFGFSHTVARYDEQCYAASLVLRAFGGFGTGSRG